VTAEEQAPRPERVADLDAARAARLESQPDGPRVRFGGVEYRLRPELADVLDEVSAIAALSSSDEPMAGLQLGVPVHAFLKKTFADGEYERFTAAGPSLADVMALVEAIPPLYGFENLGESSGSSGTSSVGSNKSNPISSVSTESISDVPRTAPMRSGSDESVP
jgi:hypothetical protein